MSIAVMGSQLVKYPTRAETNLHRACELGDLDLVKRLVGEGHDVNTVIMDRSPFEQNLRSRMRLRVNAGLLPWEHGYYARNDDDDDGGQDRSGAAAALRPSVNNLLAEFDAQNDMIMENGDPDEENDDDDDVDGMVGGGGGLGMHELPYADDVDDDDDNDDDDNLENDIGNDPGIQTQIVYNADQRTPLHISCAVGHLEIVKFLLDHGADISREDENYNTGLSLACICGHQDIVRHLLQHDADTNHHHAIALFNAIFECNLPIIQMLVDKGIDLNCQYTGVVPEYQGDSPLMVALQLEDNSSVEVFKYLVRSNININAKNLYNRRTALHYAVLKMNGALDSTRFLLEHGANPSMADKWGNTALHKAILSAGETAPTEQMESNNSDNNNNNDDNNNSSNNSNNATLELIEVLLQFGTNREAKNIKGDTPLYTAVVNDNVAIVKILIQSGILLDNSNNVGMTPLHLAAKNGSDKVVSLLLASNASTNLRSARGETALHKALKAMVEQLHENKTAQARQCYDICLELVKHGAHIDIPFDSRMIDNQYIRNEDVLHFLAMNNLDAMVNELRAAIVARCSYPYPLSCLAAKVVVQAFPRHLLRGAALHSILQDILKLHEYR